MDITHNDKNWPNKDPKLAGAVMLMPCLFASQTVLARDWEFNPQVTMQSFTQAISSLLATVPSSRIL
ncbi:MAG: hypothetical protein U1F34_05510 [Gammaproteobacteria bacterium]